MQDDVAMAQLDSELLLEPTASSIARSRPKRPKRDDVFEALFQKHYDRAVRFALLMGARDHHHARELATDAIARVWARWRLGSVDEFWPYLRTAIVNEMRSQARRKRVADRYEQRQSSMVLEPAIDLVVVERDEVAAAIEQLSPRHRMVLVLRFFEDLSTEQTAKAMRCSVGTVKSTTARALHAARAVMEERDDG